MAETHERYEGGDATDDMSLFLHHLLSSDKGKEIQIPFPVPPPSHPSDVALALAARRAVGLGGPQTGWDIFCHVKTLADDYDRNRPHLLPDRDRDRDRTSTAESSAVFEDDSRLLVHPEMKDRGSSFVDFDAGSAKRGKIPLETDFDDYDCESEEGLDGSEEQTRAVSTRTASKRSRAAEVHNLSEKRRRSRINEKMKALQNLIPNSNKTDKASMLDEAIEYLKQLQLQVQMLSMRNGLSLHPMYLPGSLQPLQIPQMSMGFGAGNGSQHMSMGVGMLSMKQEPTMQTTFGLSNQSIPLNPPPLMPGLTNITTNSETFSDLSQSHHGSFQLSAVAGETYKEDVVPQQQLEVNHLMSYPSGGPSN